MNYLSVKHLIASGFKNIWVNKLMSVASIGVLVACMSIVGLAVVFSINVENTIQDIEKENVVMVYFDDESSAKYGDSSYVDISKGEVEYTVSEDDYYIHNYEEALELCGTIMKMDNISKVVFVSNESALSTIKNDFGDNSAYLDYLNDDNPLPNGARISMIDLSIYDETISALENLEGIDSVTSSKDIAEKMISIEKALTIICFWIIAVLLIISFVIVSNTIRVTMYNRKLEISIMKAVGATDSFVRLPFLIEGVTIGLLSSAVTVIVLYFVYIVVQTYLNNIFSFASVIPFMSFAPMLFGLFAIIGCFTGVVCSAFMIGKYLKKEGSEFRAL